jgi:phosphatidylserine decarboxylase precursor
MQLQKQSSFITPVILNRQKSVEKLVQLLEQRPDLAQALESSLHTADRPDLRSLAEFFNFLDGILTHIPTESELMPSVREFYFVISKSPGDILRNDKSFNEWINEFIRCRGDFLDMPASVRNLDTFINNPEYNIDDYIKGPSGWLSYNQFLGRQLKPGKRPVTERCNDKIIVSPSDGIYKGHWPIDDHSAVTIKGTSYAIGELLGDSNYKDKFTGGIFTHCFLSITDYHRYHLPVGGVIREVKHIPGKTWVNEAVKEDGTLENIDNVGFQFTHTRGSIIIESIVGFVAVMPVGMGHISSVTLTAVENSNLCKGDEFGYFAFGGSDLVILFEPSRIHFTARAEKHYKQGEAIAHAL